MQQVKSQKSKVKSIIQRLKMFLFSLNDPMSAKAFVLTLTAILLAGFIFSAWLYYLINPNIFYKKDWRDRGPVTTLPTNFILEVNSPDDESLVFDSSVVVSGKTSPNAFILLSGEQDDLVFSASPKGEFSKVIELEEGLNWIIIYADGGHGENKQEIRMVYYSEEKL